MSGGSYDHFYYKLEDVAVRLMKQHEPSYRRAFGQLLLRCSVAMKDVEWVDSSDKSPGDDEAAILKCVSPYDVLFCSVQRAEDVMKELQNLIKEAKKK